MSAIDSARVLLVGAGGLGSPAARVLARAGVGEITVLDDDVVDVSNLQRQTLYADADLGRPKAAVAAAALRAEARTHQNSTRIVAREMRLLPDEALEAVKAHDLVVEGADNFATKFMVADACAISSVPVVQAGAVRWGGWALGSVPGRSACLRCVFEDIPRGRPDTCASAGVVGPVVGVLGALQAAIALRLLAGDVAASGELWSYRALPGSLRRVSVPASTTCPLCAGEIRDMDVERYLPPECAA